MNPSTPAQKPVTLLQLSSMKRKQEPIAMMTAYDYPSAQLAEAAGVDVILVGDSVGNVVQGRETTLPVTLEQMIYHAEIVSRAVHHPFVIADLPFATYHGSEDYILHHVSRMIRDGGVKAVKMEGGEEIIPAIQVAIKAGIPVMGHIGLMPQSVHKVGGYKVQGRESGMANKLLEEALKLEAAGVFAIVLELVTDEVAALITERLSIPTIGIGSGHRCDGQVLVFHDLINYQLTPRPKKFVKNYADVGSLIKQAIADYVADVKSRTFPAEAHTFHANGSSDLDHLYGRGDSQRS
jgi:3-methyl-2-oxobutanoate hydroxymethyltransferase